MTLNEQVAKAKGFVRKKLIMGYGISGSCKPIKEEFFVTDKNITIFQYHLIGKEIFGLRAIPQWAISKDKAFELVEEMSRNFYSLELNDHLTWTVKFTVWAGSKGKFFLREKEVDGKTPEEAICKAYIDWKKGKKK